MALVLSYIEAKKWREKNMAHARAAKIYFQQTHNPLWKIVMLEHVIAARIENKICVARRREWKYN